MTPEEHSLLVENNKILRQMRRNARWSALWGTVKFFIIVIPLIVGYLYLEPYLGPLGKTLQQAEQIIQNGGAITPR
jgi:hypothetical protein